jgi:predicted RNase H-like HicB family nuclease
MEDDVENKYTAICERSGKWWAARVVEIPGCNTQGKTLKEAKINLRDALVGILQLNQELADEQASADAVKEDIYVEAHSRTEPNSCVICTTTIALWRARAENTPLSFIKLQNEHPQFHAIVK